MFMLVDFVIVGYIYLIAECRAGNMKVSLRYLPVLRRSGPFLPGIPCHNSRKTRALTPSLFLWSASPPLKRRQGPVRR